MEADKKLKEDKKPEPKEQPKQKKTKLTKEEKKKLKKAKEEAQAISLAKQELERDMKNIRKLTNETKKQWKDFAVKIAGPHIKDLMQDVWKDFEYTMDTKDWLISELLENLQKSEEQSRKLFQDNFEQVNKLINIFEKDISEMQQDYQSSVINLLEMKAISLENKELKERNAADYLKTILYLIRKKKEEQQYAISGEYIAKREEEENKNISELEALVNNSRISMDTIWGEYKNVIGKYNEATESLQTKVAEAKERADSNEIIIRNELNKTEMLMYEIDKLKEQIKKGGIPKDKMVMLQDLRKERTSLTATLWTVKTRFREKCKLMGDQLLNLVTLSNKEINSLSLINEKAEKILTLNRLCSKLERKEERNRIYIWPSRTIIQHRSDFYELWRFWQLVGHAEIVRKCIAAEKLNLKNQNMELEKTLKTITKALENTTENPTDLECQNNNKKSINNTEVCNVTLTQ